MSHARPWALLAADLMRVVWWKRASGSGPALPGLANSSDSAEPGRIRITPSPLYD